MPTKKNLDNNKNTNKASKKVLARTTASKDNRLKAKATSKNGNLKKSNRTASDAVTKVNIKTTKSNNSNSKKNISESKKKNENNVLIKSVSSDEKSEKNIKSDSFISSFLEKGIDKIINYVFIILIPIVKVLIDILKSKFNIVDLVFK